MSRTLKIVQLHVNYKKNKKYYKIIVMLKLLCTEQYIIQLVFKTHLMI